MNHSYNPVFRRLCWRMMLATAMLTFSILQLLGSRSQQLFAADEVETVKLAVDYGDGVRKEFSRLEWKDGMTVLAALQQAAKHPRGIKPAVQGNGEFTLVIAIDELKNEGNGKNWLYKVNGKLADRSCGIYKLMAADEVVWLFTDMMP